MKRLLVAALLALLAAPLGSLLFAAAPPAPQAPAGRDPSCVQACQTRRDRETAEAAQLRDTGGYYMGLASSNCWSAPDLPPGQPEPCASGLQQCEGACASSASYTACTRQCRQTYQGCCYGNAVKIADKGFGQCVAACPATAAPVPPPPPPPTGPSGPGGEPAAGGLTAAAWQASAAQQLGADLEALKPLDQAVAGILGRGEFIVTEDLAGGFVFIDDQGHRRSLSGVAPNGSFLMLKEVDIIDFGLAGLGIASSEHGSIRGTINGGGDFVRVLREHRERQYCKVSPLEILESIAGSTLLLVSSEHGSIRGTINGGGDFIKVPPDPPTSIGDAAWSGTGARLILASTAASAMRQVPRVPPTWTLRLPGATVQIPPGPAVRTELGYNGMMALAVARGTAVATDARSGQRVPVAAGSGALVIPGKGVVDLSKAPNVDARVSGNAMAVQKQQEALQQLLAMQARIKQTLAAMMRQIISSFPSR